jgi:predicted dehydrogenase
MDLKIAIIGCGYMATDVHMPCVLKYQKEYGGIQVVACADIDLEKSKAFAEKYNIKNYFSDYHEMLEKIKPDIALGLVSETVIYKVAADILNSGIHAFIEKPPGKSIAEINYIINASNANKNFNIMVAFNRRFAPVYLKLKELCDNKKVQHLVYGMHRMNRHENHFEDTAIHSIDAVKFIMGSDYKKIKLDYQEMPEKGEKVANYHIYADFENDTTAQINVMVSTGRNAESCTLFCDDSIFYEDFISDEYGIKEYSNNKLIKTFTQNDLCGNEYINYMGFYNEHKTFYDAIKNNTPVPSIPQSAVQNVLICEAIKNREQFLEW